MATEPVELQVHGIDLLWDDGVFHNYWSCGVVHLDWHRRLRPYHFNKGLADGYHFLGSNKEATKFGRGGQGHYKANYLCNCEYGSVTPWDLIIIGEEYVCTHLAARLGFIVESCVRVCSKDHVTGKKHNSIIRVGGKITKEVINSLRYKCSGGCLLGTNGAESNN